MITFSKVWWGTRELEFKDQPKLSKIEAQLTPSSNADKTPKDHPLGISCGPGGWANQS